MCGRRESESSQQTLGQAWRMVATRAQLADCHAAVTQSRGNISHENAHTLACLHLVPRHSTKSVCPHKDGRMPARYGWMPACTVRGRTGQTDSTNSVDRRCHRTLGILTCRTWPKDHSRMVVGRPGCMVC